MEFGFYRTRVGLKVDLYISACNSAATIVGIAGNIDATITKT